MQPIYEPRPRDARQLRIIIADDDPLARRVVHDALVEAGVDVVAEASNGREAVDLARLHRPDVVLMDVVMPGVGGLQATREISRDVPETAVLMLTTSGDHDTGMVALQCGAVGFLSKDIDLEALPRALQGIKDGEAAISRQLTMRLVERFHHTRTDGVGLRPVNSVLSGREWEVLDQLSCSASTEEIADALVVSTETVRSHIKNILRKLSASSRAEAIAIARQMRQSPAAVH